MSSVRRVYCDKTTEVRIAHWKPLSISRSAVEAELRADDLLAHLQYSVSGGSASWQRTNGECLYGRPKRWKLEINFLKLVQRRCVCMGSKSITCVLHIISKHPLSNIIDIGQHNHINTTVKWTGDSQRWAIALSCGCRFFRFVTNYTCDGETDGRRKLLHPDRAGIASRGKK